MRTPLAQGAAALVLAAASAPAQLVWTLRAPPSAPSPRCCTDMAFDAARDRAVIFGGFSQGTFRDETWEWDGTTWTQSAAFGPSRRDSHTLCYDPARAETVLFGGGRGAILSGDTWVFDGVTWQLRASTGPSPRRGQAVSFDALRQRMLLFGGGGAAGLESDTWAWDGSAWTAVAPAGAGPSARGLSAMAYDVARDRAVLFGGGDGVSGVGDDETWEWDGSTWTQRFPATRPGPRLRHTLVWDTARQRVVLFGGQQGSAFLNDLWEWDGSAWLQRSPSGGPPAVRRTHAMAFDPGRELLLLFGGLNSSVFFADTWQLAPAQPATFTTFGAGCAGSAGVPALVPDPNGRPWLGGVLRVGVANVPVGSPTTMLLGLSSTQWGGISLPADLGVLLGMAGCQLYASPDVFVPFAGAFQLPLPSLASLAGITFYTQAFVVDPPANRRGVTATDRGDATIGGR